MNPLTKSLWPMTTAQPILDQTAGDLLRQAASEVGETMALVEIAPPGTPSITGASSAERTWTFQELLDDSLRCAGFLHERLAPGERIVVWAPNVPEWVILQYGAAFAGLVLVTANPALTVDELTYVLDQSKASALFHLGDFRGVDMAAVAAEAAAKSVQKPTLYDFREWGDALRDWPMPTELPTVSPDDAAQIQYTSGTTGKPKGALLHHRGLVNNALLVGVRGQVRQGSGMVSAMPLFHTAGCGMTVLGSAARRGAVYLLQFFDPTLMLATLEKYGAENACGVPTMLLAMLDDPSFAERDLSSVTHAVTGGASVPIAIADRFENEFGIALTTVYGQTELSPVATQTTRDDSRDDRRYTAGRPLDNVDVKVADPLTGEPMPIGERGEVCVRGYLTMIEYFDAPEQTAATLDADGWVHTGDLGTMDERGYLTIVGRLKDMIIRGGENIYPREIEDLLFAHPAISQATVVGVPDETWGEVVAAVVVPQPGASVGARELHDYCRDHLAPHKTPTMWRTAEAYPLTASGKIQKFQVVRTLVDGGYQPLD